MLIVQDDFHFGVDASCMNSRPGKGSESRRTLPVDVFRMGELNWELIVDGQLTGQVIYTSTLDVETPCSMEVLCASHKVYFDGRPCAVYVFHGADRKTQQVSAMRFMRDAPLIPGMSGKNFVLHRSRGAVTVITSDWDCRHLISSTMSHYFTETMTMDASFRRIMTRGSMGKDRVDYDIAILEKFMNQPFGVLEHLRGTHTVYYRFSDFVCAVQIGFGYGVTFSLTFDEPDLFIIAEALIERIRLSIINPSKIIDINHIKIFPLSKKSRKPSEHSKNSLIINKSCLTFKSIFNSYDSRLCMYIILSCICENWSDFILLEKFNLKSIDV